MIKITTLLIIVISALIHQIKAQNVSINFNNIYEFSRRTQIQLEDNTNSFCILPYSATKLDSVFTSQAFQKRHVLNSNANYTLFPIELSTEFNSKYPYGKNNGSMLRSTGFQKRLSTGIAFSFGIIDFQFQPELVWTQNRDYQGFPDSFADNVWSNRYLRTWMRIDYPERFGEKSLIRLLPGQSHFNLNFWNLSIGFSTENLWWGPGKENSLIMSNNATGFPHLHLSTTTPFETPIGALEFKVIAGKLVSSGFPPPSPNRGTKPSWLRRINSDWRYLNGAVLTWQPKWVPGLYLGAARVIQNYSDSVKRRKEFFPIAMNLLRENDVRRNDFTKDQIASVFARWAIPNAQGEIYFEYGKSDASWNIRDLLMSPEHSRAYIFGLTKLQKIESNWLEVSMEITHLEQSKTGSLRDDPGWYVNRGTRQGYTNFGEIIGAGIGTGGNMQTFNVSWICETNKFGFRLDRLVHDNDFYYRKIYNTSNNTSGNWVDLSPGLIYNTVIKRMIVKSELQLVNSRNYQWESNTNKKNLYFSSSIHYCF